MARKLWTAPGAQFLTGDDGRLTRTILTNLNEYFKRHIGFWGRYTGTTDANGRLVITHGCGFDPLVATATEHYVDTSAHDMGPFHFHEMTDTTIDVHFLTKSGQDRASHNVDICIHFVPQTGER